MKITVGLVLVMHKVNYDKKGCLNLFKFKIPTKITKIKVKMNSKKILT